MTENKTVSGKQLLLFIFIFAVIFKIVTIQMIGTDGDAGRAWTGVKELAFGLDYSMGHITSRFGKILPALFYMKIFGTHPIVYFFAPFTFFFLSVFFIFRICERVFDSAVISFWITLLFILFPNIVVAGSQLKPSIFSIGYILGSVYFILKYCDEEGKRKFIFLIFSALFLFGAYLAKITNLFFLPGIALLIVIKKRSFKDFIIFGSVLLGLFLIETAVYINVFDSPLGRLSVVSGSHLVGNESLQPVDTFFHLLTRFTQAKSFWYPFLFLYFIGGGYYLLRDRKNRVYPLLIVSMSFLFFITFAVKSVSPVIPALPFNDRYLNVALPFIIAVDIYFIYTLLKERIQVSFFSSKRFYILFVAIFLICGSFIYQMVYMNYYKHLEGNFFNHYPLTKIFQYNSMLNEAYTEGIPIVTPKLEPKRYKKQIVAVQEYLDAGISLDESLEKVNITQEYYEYCLHRVTDGDYKARKTFWHFFLDIKKVVGKNAIEYPPMQKLSLQQGNYGVIIDHTRYDGSPEGAFASVSQHPRVLWMDVKPYRAEWREW